MKISAILNKNINFTERRVNPSVYDPHSHFSGVQTCSLCDSVEFSKNKSGLKHALEVFNRAGIDAQILEDETLLLTSYEPDKSQMKILSGKEGELFKHVSEIRDYANFERSELTSTGALRKIGKNAVFSASKIEELPNLEYVGKDLYLNNSKIKTLPENLFVNRSIIADIDNTTADIINTLSGDEYSIKEWGEGLVRIYNNNYNK